MSRAKVNLKRAAIALGLMLLLVTISCCAKPEQQLLGKWVSSRASSLVITFGPDGTYEYAYPSGKEAATYRVQGTQILLDFSDGTQYVMEYKLTGDRLTLKADKPLADWVNGDWERAK